MKSGSKTKLRNACFVQTSSSKRVGVSWASWVRVEWGYKTKQDSPLKLHTHTLVFSFFLFIFNWDKIWMAPESAFWMCSILWLFSSRLTLQRKHCKCEQSPYLTPPPCLGKHSSIFCLFGFITILFLWVQKGRRTGSDSLSPYEDFFFFFLVKIN